MSRIDGQNIKLGDSFVIQDAELVKKYDSIVSQAQATLVAAKAQAEKILEDTKNQAEQLKATKMAELNDEMETLKQSALEESKNKGRDEGLQLIASQLQDKVNEFEKFLDGCYKVRENILVSAQKDILELVIAVSRKIFSDAIQNDEKYLSEFIKNAINSIPDKEEVSVIVHPSMTEKIYGISDSLSSSIKNMKSLKIIEDSSLSEGGLVIETIESRIDAGFENQLDKILKDMKEHLRKELEEKAQSVDKLLDIDKNAGSVDNGRTNL